MIPNNFYAILGSFKSIQEFHGVENIDINYFLSNYPQYGDENNLKKLNNILYDYYWSPDGDGYLKAKERFDIAREIQSAYNTSQDVRDKVTAAQTLQQLNLHSNRRRNRSPNKNRDRSRSRNRGGKKSKKKIHKTKKHKKKKKTMKK